MDVLVAQQDDTINAIETSATQVHKDTEAGYVTVRSTSLHLTGVAASDRRKKLFGMPGQLAASVGSVFSCFSLSWPLLALRLGSLLESIRWLFIIWTLN
jgi:hypothetical protein